MDKRILSVTATLAGFVAVAGCGSGQAGAPSPVASSSAPTQAGAQVTNQPTRNQPVSNEPNPNATESSPPGDIPDNTVYLPYKATLYQIKVPEGWARTDLPAGAASFTDKLNGIRIETVKAGSAPTPETAKRDEIPKLQAARGNFQLKKIETVTRKGGQGVRIVYLVDSAPNPVTGKVIRDEAERYEFFRNGQEAVLTLSGPVGADNVDPWRLVSDSFRWA